MRGAVRIVLADDHRVVREGLRALLESETGFAVVGEACEGARAVELTRSLTPDVAVLDIAMPGLDGVEAAQRIRALVPSTAIVMLSMHNDGPTVERAFAAGALGYVLKGSGIGGVFEAIRTVVAGNRYVGTGVSDYVQTDDLDGVVNQLTPRERQILKLVGEGNTGREIAAVLSISPKTVENHRGRLMEKLDIRSTASLIRFALKSGISA